MSASKAAERYVLENPSIKDSIEKDLINYSKLARTVIKETNLKKEDFDAVLVALRRLKHKYGKKKSYQQQIKEVLKDTTLDIKTNMYVCILEKDIIPDHLLSIQKTIKKDRKTMHLIEGSDATTIITEQQYKPLIRKHYKNKTIKETEDVITIIMRSPASLEEVPGVVGFIYSLFSTRGINILETMSCWRDTILVIEKKNLQAAVELLNF